MASSLQWLDVHDSEDIFDHSVHREVHHQKSIVDCFCEGNDWYEESSNQRHTCLAWLVWCVDEYIQSHLEKSSLIPGAAQDGTDDRAELGRHIAAYTGEGEQVPVRTSFLDSVKTSNTLLGIQVTPTSPGPTLWSYKDIVRLMLFAKVYDGHWLWKDHHPTW